MALELKSPDIMPNETIPTRFTCQGEEVSPALTWSGVPQETKSFALLCDDPDAPSGDWVHWVVFNIPKDARGLPENILAQETLKDGSRQGVNDSHKIGYDSPCPPPGRPHRYFFKLYALDTVLDIKREVTKKILLSEMQGHVLAEAKLVGTYQR